MTTAPAPTSPGLAPASPRRRRAGLVVATARLAADVAAADDLLRRQLRRVAATATSATALDEEVARLRQPEDGVRLLLARRDGHPVGVARARYRSAADHGPRRAHAAQLTHLHIVPEARGTGVGEALVSQATVMAWWFGCGELRAVKSSWTGEAVHLLERMGMAQAGPGVMSVAVGPAPSAS